MKNPFKRKVTMMDYSTQLSTLADIEEELKNVPMTLFLGRGLPDELENFRKGLLSKIEYKRQALEKECKSLAYTEKFNKFKNLEKQIMSMGFNKDD